MAEAVKQQSKVKSESPTKAPEKTNKHRPWWQHALELSVFLPLTILGLEGLFAVTGIGEQEFLHPDLQLGCLHIPGKLVTWRLEGYSRDYLSSAGQRDVEHQINAAPDTYRIAFLGDSATEGLQVPLKDTFPRLLEAKLNAKAQAMGSKRRFEVFNFGCSSYSTGQEVLTYEKYIRPYKPDLVMAMYTTGDTLENCINFAHLQNTEPRPYFYLENNQLKEDDSILEANKEKLSPHPIIDFLRSKSRIYGVYNQTLFSLKLTDKIYNRFANLLSSLENKAKGKKALPLPSYPQPDGFAVTTALINRLHADATADGARFTLLSFPDICQTDKNYPEDQRRLAIVADQGKFDCINANAYFKAQPNAPEQYLQVHLSTNGHASMANFLADYVSSVALKK